MKRGKKKWGSRGMEVEIMGVTIKYQVDGPRIKSLTSRFRRFLQWYMMLFFADVDADGARA